MREIDLNLLTLYADLMQRAEDVAPWEGSVTRRTVAGITYLYLTTRGERKQKLLGPESDPEVAARAEATRRLQARRRTVSTLKRARIPAPSVAFGRTLEVMADAGLFRAGVVLVGTVAYQIFPCIIGKYLSGGALQTQDADIALKSSSLASADTLEIILQRANPAFAGLPVFNSVWPKTFAVKGGLSVDVLMPGAGEKLVKIKALGCVAQQLKFLEYLVEDPVQAVALYGAGVPVLVPQPARYAVHKLIVAGRRKIGEQKARKDLMQAQELFGALEAADIDDALADARGRGPSWRKAVDAGLAKIKYTPVP